MSPATGIGRAEVPTTPLTRADCWTRLLAGFTARARHPVVRRIAIVTRQRVIARHALKLARAAVSRVVHPGGRRSRRRAGRRSLGWRGCRCGARGGLPQDDETIVVIRDCDIKSTIVLDVTNRNTVGTIAAGIWNLVNLFAREPAVAVLEIDTSPLISVVNYNYVLPPVPVDISRLHGTGAVQGRIDSRPVQSPQLVLRKDF